MLQNRRVEELTAAATLPLAISTTGALLGVEQVAVTPDGKVVVPVDSLAVGRKR
jgi:hypothetical protein